MVVAHKLKYVYKEDSVLFVDISMYLSLAFGMDAPVLLRRDRSWG
jgi:hypothetical protein